MRALFRAGVGSLIVSITCTAGWAAAPTQESDPFVEAERRVVAQFRRIEEEIVRLRGTGLSADAAQMESELAYFKMQLTGARPTRIEGPRLDWIGVHSGPSGSSSQPVDVTVHPTDQPVILALTSSRPVSWRLNLQPGAQLDRVIVYGAEGAVMPQNLPGTVPLELYARGSEHGLSYAYDVNFENYLSGLRGLHAHTGFRSFSLQGASQPDGGQSFSIGRTNPDWRAQHVLREMRPLYEEATAHGRAQQRAAVAGERFTAVLRTPLNQRWAGQSAIAEFTPFSAVYDTIRPVDARVEHMTFDPASGRYFGFVDHRAYEIDPESGEMTIMPGQPLDNPEVSWPSGMAFDTNRRRLIVATLGGAGEFYSYELDARRWSLLASLNNLDLQGLTYVESEDAFYGMSRGGNGGSEPALVPDLVRFDAQGRVTGRVSIATRLPMEGNWGHQLFTVGDKVGLLTQAVEDLDHPLEDAASRFLLIDPATGDVTYSGIMVVPEPAVAMLIFVSASLVRPRRRC